MDNHTPAVPLVHLQRDGDIAIVEIDHPPVNALSAQLRHELLAALTAADADPALQGVVIIGAGASFIGGADLKEFGQPLAPPQLPDVIEAIERCSKPVVAALHGAALGGGFELALGCDSRIALQGCVIGLPEVSLGIIPGAGGTQRLPRVVGVVRAIELIARSERIDAATALQLGLLDQMVSDDLLGAAVARARALGGRKVLLSGNSVPPEAPERIVAATAAALKAGRHRPAVLAAVDAVLNAALLPLAEALALERSAFEKLRLTAEARALRHLFFAERSAGRPAAAKPSRPRDIATMAVIGAGTMGTGIAICALDAGISVVLLEQSTAALTAGLERIAQHYARRVQTGKLDAAAALACQQLLAASTDWDDLKHADLVLEAVFENLEVKQDVFRRIALHARPDALLASNTSYLDLDAIAVACGRPQDVLGLHFFSPAHVMRLLEVVQGRDTSAEALATGLALARRLRKLPVVTRNAFGFIGNRIYAAYRRQCEFMLEEGAYPEQIDAALERYGFAMGPFAVSDMSGLDIAWRMRQSQAAQRDVSARYVDIPDRLCEAGRLGRKTGAGYYRYDGDQAGGADPEVSRLIEAASSAKQITRRALDDEEICRRAMLAMVNEAAALLAEGVATRASDIDVVLTNGYGFPRWKGGPVFWARERGATLLTHDLDWLSALSGSGFVEADIHCLF